MKIMMSAGEASGDMHAAAVAAELKRIMPDADLFGMGGADMRKSGVRIIYDIENLGIIGVVEVIRHIPFFFRLRAFLKKAMVEEKPDVLVCVDYPGFNMKLAHVAKELGIPVIYYIAPTIWAWNKGRAKNIVRDVEQVASIFPFEAEAYRKAGARVTFVGHPLADTVKPSMSFEEAMDYFHGNPDKKRVLLMPGSRKNEVAGLLPVMIQAAEKLAEKEECQFFIPRASTISKEMLLSIIGKTSLSIEITEGHQYDLMQICTACVASSGTATLETALMELPTVLVYKLAPFTWFLANLLVHVKYAGLPNLLLGREVTPELLQDRAQAENIVSILLPWLQDEKARQKNIEEIREVRKALGSGGAVHRVAELIIKTAGAVHGK
ncbi:lipid-A-disaccharide synthase [Dialister sp.]|jgi:lipid-A-disaccharide synthase|uniref:lipid-A-disaccharide synthase n=1 Tax=Dialister sp. TaxID=1955814 RepID=UPI0025F9F91A|nr:lipid-A-disaccharide synthase [Dialister sp.]MEE0292589.1 lipid-A-disaccharide synthase [Dialister sp.]